MGVHGEKSLGTVGIQGPADESAVQPKVPGSAPECQASPSKSIVVSLREVPSQRDLSSSLSTVPGAEMASRSSTQRSGGWTRVRGPGANLPSREEGLETSHHRRGPGRRENSQQGGGGTVRGMGRALPPESLLGEQEEAF